MGKCARAYINTHTHHGRVKIQYAKWWRHVKLCVSVCASVHKHTCCLNSAYGAGARRQLGLAWITAPWLGHCSSDTPPLFHTHTHTSSLCWPFPNKLPDLFSSPNLPSFCSAAYCIQTGIILIPNFGDLPSRSYMSTGHRSGLGGCSINWCGIILCGIWTTDNQAQRGHM